MRAVETTSADRCPRVWPLSVKAYHALGELGLIPEHTELLYGQVFERTSKSPLHSALVMRLLRLLQALVPAGWHVRVEQPITCGDSEPEPDLAVVTGREEDFWVEHPVSADLVIEVCVTSHDFDRTKLRAYATAGVKEVWLVLGPERRIEVWRKPAGDRFSEQLVFNDDQSVISVAVPQMEIEVRTVFER